MIRYSIIIPHKNTPKLLQRCLDSIPRRDDVQMIVVDDNSDSDKVDFEHFPGLDDPTAEVYLTKEGRGAGYARNVGLEHAKGEWVLFADADDAFTENVNRLLDEVAFMEEDVIFFKMSSVNLADGTDGHRGDEFNRRVDVALSCHDFGPVLKYSSPWGKIIRRQFLSENGISFNEVRYSNDVVFIAKVATTAETFYAMDIVSYCISVSSNSLTSTMDKSSSVIRLNEDLEGLKICRHKFKLTREDKYWLFFSWRGVYEYNRCIAMRFVPKMMSVLGLSFIEDALRMMYHNFAHRQFFRSIEREE